MAQPMSPLEIARETLRRLAVQRTPPTPDNYRDLYHEISGTAATETFPEKSLKALATSMPRATPEQLRFARVLETAVGEGSWDALKTALAELATRAGATPPDWNKAIRELLGQLEIRHAGITAAKKREALDHVLTASGTPDSLYARLQALTRSWGQNGAAVDGPPLADEPLPLATAAVASAAAPTPAADTRPINGDLQELLAQLLENAISILLVDTPELGNEATELAAEIRAATSPAQVTALTAKLKRFSYRLQFVAEDQAELRAALMHLLRLIIENINELVLDDQWLQGQVFLVRELIQHPLDLRQLDDVERRLKDLIFKQSNLKKSLNDAQERLKAMLASFVDRLADMATSTGDYHDKITRCAEKITQARDISDLSNVIDEVMAETRNMQLSALRSRDELVVMKSRVQEAEQEVGRLQNELAQASEMVRHDPLTGALNRKGMDEALSREIGRARRKGAALCLAMLDIDNFKRLNDTYGHDVGDQALVHLARVVRETLRPQDTLARYGGEEFVIVLADTALDDAVKAMVRVQRELTRRFFLHRNEKLLITFSCGVAELGGEEAAGESLKRADAAMYLAKRAGKNRVVAA